MFQQVATQVPFIQHIFHENELCSTKAKLPQSSREEKGEQEEMGKEL